MVFRGENLDAVDVDTLAKWRRGSAIGVVIGFGMMTLGDIALATSWGFFVVAFGLFFALTSAIRCVYLSFVLRSRRR
jgi:hypothetical protein